MLSLNTSFGNAFSSNQLKLKNLRQVFLVVILVIILPGMAWGQISFVGSNSANSATITLPTGWQAGDLALVFAFRDGSTTSPALDNDFTNITTWNLGGPGQDAATRFAYRTLQSGDATLSFTFTDATETEIMVLRGASATGMIAKYSTNSGNNDAISYAALTGSTAATSWIVGFGGHRTATDANTATATNMTIRSATTASTVGMHSRTGITSFTSTNWSTVNESSKWLTISAEILAATPTLSVTPTSLAFGYTANGSTSVEQSYVLSGTNLTAPVVVTPPSGFEISTTSGSGFSTSAITLTPTSGSVNQSIYVVFHPTSTQAYTGNITHTSTGAGQKDVAVTGTSVLSYCNSNFTDVRFEFVSNVTFAGINNSSAGNTGGPVNYTNHVAQVVQGNTYAISVTIEPDNNDYIYGFIDWNQNGNLNDAGEVYTIASNTSVAGPHILNITVPSGATIGATRMRVMLDWYNAIPNSCRSAMYGEAEDYTVNVTAACTTPTPGNTLSTSNPVCSDSPFTLSLANPGSGVTYQWQSSLDGTTWNDMVAPTFFNSDFSSQPANTNNYGNTTVTGGELILTPVNTSQNGSFVIQKTPGSNITSFTASYDYRIYDGTGADGLCFNYAPDVTNGVVAFGENGEGTGIRVSFDTYNSGTKSQIFIYYNGGVIWQNAINDYNLRNTSYRNVIVTVDAVGNLSLSIGGTSIVSGLLLTGYAAADKTNWKFKFTARTGASTDKHSIDNLNIQMGSPTSPTYTTSQTVSTFYRCQVTCSGNTVASTPLQVITTPAPVAAFSGSPTTVSAGNQVTFTDASTNIPTSWSWTFTGGTPGTSTAQNPVITYNTVGTFTVSLTATNACGSDVETKADYITVTTACTNPTTGGTITADQTICSGGDPAEFTSTALPTGHTGTLEYKWQSSTTGSGSGFSDISPSATGLTYDVPSGLMQTTWYKRLSKVTCSGTWATTGESNVLEVTVEDNTAPVANVASLPDITAECSVATLTAPTATDNCEGTITGTHNVTLPITAQGTTTITWTYDDGNGNTSTQTQNVIIDDLTIPSITCPANISVNNDAGTCGATVTYTAPVGTDNCAGATTTQTAGLASGSTFPVGVTINTFSVTDAAGLTATCSFTVTVTDNQAPAISCPANISVNNDAGTCGAVVTYTAPVGTDNCAGATTTQTAGLASGATFPIGVTTNTFSVTDAAGNSTSCSFTVTVVDNQAPAITCPTNISINNDAETCGAVVTYTAPVGTDNCAGATTTQTAGLASGATFPIGVTTNTFSVTDAAGNSTSCSFTVTVVDNQVPAITCPTNISINNDAETCGAVVTYTAPVGTDNCVGATTTQTAGLASGSTFPIGVTTNTFRVTDAVGNSTSCSFTVTVNPDPVDIEVVPLGDFCQSGETDTQTPITWTINKTSGVGDWSFTYTITGGTTPVTNTVNVTGSNTATVNFVGDNTTGVSQSYTVEITGVTDSCGTTETNTANNNDSVTLYGVPDTSDIQTN